MTEQAIIRAEYHRLERECHEIQARLARAEAELTRVQTDLDEARHALDAIADGAASPVLIARATTIAIDQRALARG
ncbi:MAG: hypothetical protein MUD01_28805, partial [Chloroflexaceae bacterium]|nr:hypothetical protein [Chloroflexaceae bacterium]